MDKTLKSISDLALSRRGFLVGAGAISAATMIGCGDDAPAVVTPPVTAGITDVDILNFALNLEYLEAEFYLRAATGSGIPTADGGGATVTAPSTTKVTFSNTFYQQFAFELAQTELQHVRAIRATITSLNGTPVAAPAINFTDAFNAVASLAGLTTFNPFSSDTNFLIGALTFEEVGVSAYTGAARLITAQAVLDAAAGIQAAEAYHAGAIRTIMAGSALSGSSTASIDAYNKILTVLNQLDGTTHTTPLAAGGVASTNATVGTVYSPASVVTADGNALAYARTTDQVLHIAYATKPGTLTAAGGFFPSGLNGTIKTPTT